MAKAEADNINNLEERINTAEKKIDALAQDAAEIKGILTNMPAAWQVMWFILAIMGGAFAIIRFGIVH